MDLDDLVMDAPSDYRWMDGPEIADFEAMIVSACILAPSCYPVIAGKVSDVDFTLPGPTEIWRAIGRVVAAGNPIDIALVWHQVRPGSITRERFVEIVDSCPNTANADHYAARVQEAAAQRRIADMRRLLAPSCRPVGEIIAAAEMELADVRRRMAGAESSTITDLVRTEIADYQTALSGGSVDTEAMITTGLPTLDDECGPMVPGYLIVIGARPSMGKSSLALQIAARASDMHGPVLIFPIETGAAQISRNVLSQVSQVSCEKLTQRKPLSEVELMGLMRAAEKVCHMRLWVDDTAALTVEQAWGRAAALQAKHGLSLVVVDYLQLLRSSTVQRGRSREQEVSEISRGLKAMARSLNVPVVACAQISRASEAGEDKRPKLAHLRESGQIEQDADVVILLHRQERYTPEDGACQGWAEAIVAKRKVGRSGGVAHLGFDGSSLRFYERARGSGPDDGGNPFSRPRADHDL